MKKRNALLLFVLSIVFSAFIGSCGNSDSGRIQESREKTASLLISAAASLKDSLEEIKTGFADENPNITITYTFGSSGTLQKQIEQGADADIFISAGVSQMDALEKEDLIMKDTRKNLLGNRIVLVVPEDSTAVTDFRDLTSDKVKVIALGETKTVPAGQYGAEALTKMNLMDFIKSKIVYGKDVKEVLTWVETGNADAGIVYTTDAKVSKKVKVVAEAPEGTYTPVVYPAAVIKTSKNADAAKEFINYLYSSKAASVFEKYGFTYLVK